VAASLTLVVSPLQPERQQHGTRAMAKRPALKGSMERVQSVIGHITLRTLTRNALNARCEEEMKNATPD
jgi:hypothetical protein